MLIACWLHRQVITTLLGERMFGEGDLLRHLSQLTYKLMYHQDPLAEFDFSLASMSADLKDGLRLCKLAEALTGKEIFMLFSYPNCNHPGWGLHDDAYVLHGKTGDVLHSKNACQYHHFLRH